MFRPAKEIPVRAYDVVVCGGGTGGVFAAISAARNGARTLLIESKGYVGGIAAEGGCGLHSFYNLWQAFPGIPKTKVVRGLPEEFINRLTAAGGASGHNDTALRYEYDSDALCVDVEVYKYIAAEMLLEAGVTLMLDTMVTDAVIQEGHITGVITESHQGCIGVSGKVFIDATGYGDLAARAGAQFTEPNDMAVANSIGIAGIEIEKYFQQLKLHGALNEYALGKRSGGQTGVIRTDGILGNWDKELEAEAERIGMNAVTTSFRDNYLMFIKLNYQTAKSPSNVDAASEAEVELRRRQQAALSLLKRMVPGSNNAFIARSGPCIAIRRGRCIVCEYDLSNEEILDATHFSDDIFCYSFHDEAPKYQIRAGSNYGFPYRAIIPKELHNLFTIGMMVTSDYHAHMSTRNTVSCMAQGQAAGTAAALCTHSGLHDVRNLPYQQLRQALVNGKVWFEPAPLTYKP